MTKTLPCLLLVLGSALITAHAAEPPSYPGLPSETPL